MLGPRSANYASQKLLPVGFLLADGLSVGRWQGDWKAEGSGRAFSVSSVGITAGKTAAKYSYGFSPQLHWHSPNQLHCSCLEVPAPARHTLPEV